MTIKLVFRPVCQTTTFLIIIYQKLVLRPAFIPWTPEWWTWTCGPISIVFLISARITFSTTILIIGNQGINFNFINTFQIPKSGLRMAYPMEVTRPLQIWQMLVDVKCDISKEHGYDSVLISLPFQMHYKGNE
jgi:hypothetical protein